VRKNIQKMATSVAQSGLETAGEGAFALGRSAWLVGLGLAATASETSVGSSTAGRQGAPSSRTHAAGAAGAHRDSSTMLKLANDATRIAQQRAAAVMGQFGLPTRDDVRELMRRVDTLRQAV
jgi:hypothetical protein